MAAGRRPRLPRRPSRLRLVALGADAGAPLVRFVAMRGGVPEDLARTAILRGGAFVGRRRVRDPEGAIREGDRVEVDLREPPPAERRGTSPDFDGRGELLVLGLMRSSVDVQVSVSISTSGTPPTASTFRSPRSAKSRR